MHRPVFSILTASFALIGLACSEEVPPEFAPGTFGAANRAQIENDCDRRIMCAQRTNPHLRADVFEDCVSENATNLNALEEFRLKWSIGIRRCFQEDACQYQNCVDSTFVSWGESQRPKIENICMQTQACAIENGMLAVAPQTYFEDCRVQRILLADMILPDQRTSFTNAYFQCETQVGCAFQLCFPY